MKPIMIDQLKELNAMYCLIILDKFGEIGFKQMVLANFILRYPANLKKLDSNVKLKEEEMDNISIKEKFKFHDSWERLTLDSLRILVCKELAEFKKDLQNKIIKNKETSKAVRTINQFEEFDEVIERSKIIKKIFKNKSDEEVIRIING